MIKPSILNSSVSAVSDNIFEQFLDISSIRSATLQVSGTFVLSLKIEVSNDPEESPTNWFNVSVIPADGSGAVNEITAPGMYILPLGYRAMRLKCVTRTSGTAEVESVFSQNDPVGIAALQKDPADRYKISDIDDASNPQYYGYIDESGRWYIMRYNTSSKEIRYSKGDSSYGTNWTNRASLTYEYFNLSF